MTRIALLLLLSLSSACATAQVRRCNALRGQAGASSDACFACTDTLTEGGDARLCEEVCAPLATFTEAMVKACAAAAPEKPKKAKPVAASAEQ